MCRHLIHSLVLRYNINHIYSAIEKVATLIIEGPVAAQDLDQENPTQNTSNTNTPEQIWTSLLILTSTHARPSKQQQQQQQQQQSDDKNGHMMGALQLKLRVLANMMDCAVQNTDLRQRRLFIERIMSLPKSIQKTLMGLIEKRGKQQQSTPNSSNSTSSKRTPTKQSTPAAAAAGKLTTPLKSALKKKSTTPNNTTPPRPNRSTSAPPSRGTTHVAEPSIDTAGSSYSSYHESDGQQCATPGSTASSHTTVARDNTSATRPTTAKSQQQHRTPKNKSGSSRTHSAAFSPTGLATPEPKRFLSRRASSSDNLLLSPGTLESPSAVQSVVADLQRQVKKYQEVVHTLQQRDQEHVSKLEQTQAAHRKQMIKVEAAALDRETDLQRQFEERLDDLQTRLDQAEVEREQGRKAVEELAQARDDMDLMNHNKSALQQTTEKLRKYKDKITELQDVKETLQHEQDAHGQSIDEVVRLENELQSLLPLKRQLDNYKIRAIEAEVKLVENQDYLRRLEQQASDQNMNNEHLWKGAAIQQEEMEKLQRRIQQETAAAMESGQALGGGGGVGDGVSELNPEIQRELFRLRNENLQLRAFAAKRETDGVQKLEAALEDTNLLADRYKQEFLSTKKEWMETKGQLVECEERETAVTKEMEQWRQRSDQAVTRTRVLEEKLDQGREHLESARKTLQDVELRNANLLEEIEELTAKTHQAETVSSQNMQRLQSCLRELQQAQSQLETAQELVNELRSSVAVWQVQCEEMDAEKKQSNVELGLSQEALTDNRVTLAEAQKRETKLESQVTKMKEERVKLEALLEEERQSKYEAAEEAHLSLEATRHLLTAKSTKELEELQTNMNQLLEDERSAYHQQSEEADQKYQQLETKWNEQVTELTELSTSALLNSRQEAQERIELIQKACQAELEQTRKEADESTDHLVRKGRALINEAKNKAKEELQAMDDECKDMGCQLNAAKREKQDIERALRSKVSSLKRKIEFTANQINDLTRDGDEFQEKVKMLEREKFKLQEDNDRYRRQLGGRYGADGKSQAQLEKLQREYNAILDENRNLKKQSRNGGANALGAISESLGEGESQGYTRGGVSRTTLSQMRQEYEEQLEFLNDEKRELIMKNSAAATDVQKAEQRAWEREQELAKLKAEITSLQLAQHRVEFSQDRSIDHGQEGLSFFSAHDEEHPSPGYSAQKSPHIKDGTPRRSSDRIRNGSSPLIEKATRQRNEREMALRIKLSSLTSGSPARQQPNPMGLESTDEGAVLTSTHKHESEANTTQETLPAKLASDVFGLRSGEKSLQSSGSIQQHPKTLMDYTRVDESQVDLDARPECQQS